MIDQAILAFLEGKDWTRTHEIFDHIDEFQCGFKPEWLERHIDSYTLRDMVKRKAIIRKDLADGDTAYMVPSETTLGQRELF